MCIKFLSKGKDCKVLSVTPISESDRFYSMWHPFPTSTYSEKRVNPITTRDFKQSRTRAKKRSIYACKTFLSLCLSDLVPLEHPICSTVFADINLNFIIHTAILRNGSFPHVNSKVCRFCRKYYLKIILPLNAIILS